MKKFSVLLAALISITIAVPTMARAEDKPMEKSEMHHKMHHKMMKHHRMHHEKMMKHDKM